MSQGTKSLFRSNLIKYLVTQDTHLSKKRKGKRKKKEKDGLTQRNPNMN